MQFSENEVWEMFGYLFGLPALNRSVLPTAEIKQAIEKCKNDKLQAAEEAAEERKMKELKARFRE